MAEKSYRDFYAELTSQFHSPVEKVISSFERMEAEATEENLRFFLLGFRENYEALLALRRYLQQQQSNPSLEPMEPFQILRMNYDQKIHVGLSRLLADRESRATRVFEGTNELNDVWSSFSTLNISVAG